MENISGLLVFVYRDSLGDCTGKGLTSKKDELILVGDSIKNSPFSPKEDEDYLVIQHRPFLNDYIATPKSVIDSGKHSMFGGNFVYTSDSRFPSKSPVKVFDRVENK